MRIKNRVCGRVFFIVVVSGEKTNCCKMGGKKYTHMCVGAALGKGEERGQGRGNEWLPGESVDNEPRFPSER